MTQLTHILSNTDLPTKFGGKWQNHYLCTSKPLKVSKMNKTVFRRKIYEDMLNWKNEQKGETALLVEGARRIGKSTIVEEFAKREYDSFKFRMCSTLGVKRS